MSSASRRSNGGASSSSSSASSPTRTPRDSRPLLPRTPPVLVYPPAPPPLHITIRFSTSLPDLHLDIPAPQQTTVVALKHLIRGRLAVDATAEDKSNPDHPSRARLRFIHNGRILPDTSVLGAVLKVPPPPPLSQHQPDPKGKGKAKPGFPPQEQQQRVFINCSIGDTLTDIDLAAEAVAASTPPPPPPSPSPSPSSLSKPPPPQPPPLSIPPLTNQPANQNTPRPLGFDRLLQAGFTRPEVSLLRRQFRAFHTARFTPDTMPSPDSLRAMEDAWLDNDSSNAAAASSSFSNSTAAANFGAAGGEEVDGLEVGVATEDVYGLSAVAGPLIRGMLIGFVFPLGVMAWAGKEEGMWSRRMQMFVFFGVLLSWSVGLVRGLTGEG
ncbi:DSC E3 ubiquitin ligase complex subunit 3 [Madurella mycetomatis]|uniref:DSC E3 ubiquitin ligase complex subunit 3 n=1 Tax=Madurella mycetomatis TaxID=100816 RepID=A0A175WFM7_9PEZI|nr:DSC E3 ubiquitin ligase complex subunit 3 [Madurella mycetomatis]